MFKNLTYGKLWCILILIFFTCCISSITSSFFTSIIYIGIIISYLFFSYFIVKRSIVESSREYMGVQVIISLIYWLLIGKVLVEQVTFYGIIILIFVMSLPYIIELSYKKEFKD